MQEKRWVITFVVIIFVIAILGVGAVVYQQQQIGKMQRQLVSLQSSPEPAALVAATNDHSLSPSTGTAIATTTTASANGPAGILQQQIDDLTARVAQLEKKVGVQSSNRQTNPAVKEYIIYLGSGQTDNRDWTDISSAVAAINTANYGQLKAVYFEAALSIIGGEAHARLENQTTGQVIYQTEVVNNTSSATWETSSAFTLSSGQNSYMVQLRSTSGEMAILSGSRIHLFLQ